MPNLLPFFIVLFAGLFFSKVFRRLHLPWATALIIAGIVIGPSGFAVFEANETINFLGEIGLVFLMFMAGLETRISDVRGFAKEVSGIAVLNGSIPFLTGLFIARVFGFGWPTSLLLGVIFISSSIAVVVPSLEENNLFHIRIGKVVIGTTMIQDIASLILLSVFFQSSTPTATARLPLPLFYGLLFVILFSMRYLMPRVMKFFASRRDEEKDIYERELRVVFVALIGTVVIFELLGLHSIIAGFFAGLILSESIESDILKSKLHAISYGVYIPTFFVIVGANINLGVLSDFGSTLLLALALVVGSVASKFVSGWFGSRLFKFSNIESVLVGVSSVPQLSTTLAVAFTGLTLGFLDETLVAVLVFLSMITTLVGTVATEAIAKRVV